MTGEPNRDRDRSGRARNARPRDTLGRPLPHGSAGVEPVPDDLNLTADETLGQAQLLLDAGRPFQAHEVLESRWKQTRGREREFWRGLAQVAVAVTHWQRGNEAGAEALLARSAARLRPFAGEQPFGVDIEGVLSWIAYASGRAPTGATEAPRLVPSPPGLVPSAGPSPAASG